MPDPDPLLPYVQAWRQARSRGRDPSPEELCRDRPDLVPALTERLAAERAADDRPSLFADTGTLHQPIDSLPDVPVETTPADQPSVVFPDRIGHYRLLDMLGQGGMGAVFLAEDLQLGRRVAVKLILPGHAGKGTVKQRFLREAKVQATLDHDNITPIYQVGEENGTLFIVMPLLRGQSLRDRLKKEERLPVGVGLRIARDIAEGLAAAHEAGIVHRDMKPGNVWLEGDPAADDPAVRCRRARLLDFGLARGVDGAEDQQVTRAGEVLGTPAYMAPEQAGGQKVDQKADLFALGVMMYEMATGVHPFEGPTMMATMLNVATVTPPPAAAVVGDVPADLSALIDRLIAKSPSLRPASAREVADEIRRMLAPTQPPPPSQSTIVTEPPAEPAPPRRGPWVLAGVLAAVAAAAAALIPFIPRPPKTVDVSITTTPPGATATADPGRLPADARTPLRYATAPTPHEVTLRLDGYAPQKLAVDPEQTRDYAITLVPVSPPPPPPLPDVTVRVNVTGATVRAAGPPPVPASPGDKPTEWVFRPAPAKTFAVLVEKSGFAPVGVTVDTARATEYPVTLAPLPQPTPATMRVLFRPFPPGSTVLFASDTSAKPSAGAAGEFVVRRAAQTATVQPPGHRPVTVDVPLPPVGADRVEVPVPLVPLPPPDRYTDSAGIELRLIPAGTFTMPSVPPGPDRRVTITKPYYLGRTEVTRGQFRAFVEATGHVTAAEKKAGPGGEGYTPTGKTLITADPRFTWRDPGFPQSDDQPVVNVSWDDAKAFCDWLGKKEGKAYRLPTEAEWDFAAREGGQELLPFDAAPGEVVRHANVADAALRRRVLEDNPKLALPAAFAVAADDRHPFTAPVGRFEANRFGLADTFGNVSEWCLDWSGPTADLPTRDPVQTAEPKDRTRIARGGSFLNPGTPAALTGRYRYPSDRGNIQTGFRVCVEVGGGAAAAR